MIVILLHDEVGGIDIVHPGRDIVDVVVLALAGDGIAEYGALDVGAAEEANGPDDPGGDPVGGALLVDLELGGVKEVGGVAETQVAHDVAVEGLGEGVLHALLEPHHAGLLGDHVHQHIGGQAVASVGEPLDEVGVVNGCHPDGPALVVDLGGVVGVLELAHHVAEGAHLAVPQVLGGGPVQGGDLVEGDLGDVLGKVAVGHGEQVPVGGGPEDGHGDQGADDAHGDEQHHEDAHREALGLHKAEVLFQAGAGSHAEAGGEEGGHHKDEAEKKDKGVEVPVLEVQGGEGEVEVDEAEHQSDGQAEEDAGGLAHGFAGGIPVHKKLLLNGVAGSGHLGLDVGLGGLHGPEGHVQQLVQVPAQQLGALLDDLPGAAGGELLVLELLLQGLELHVGTALGGAHEGGGADEAGELVAGEEDLLHLMLGLDVAHLAPTVAGGGVDEGLVQADLTHELLGLDAVLLGPLLEVQVVEETDDIPEFGVVAITQLPGEPLHDRPHGEAVADVEGLLIIFFQQVQGLGAGEFHGQTLLI